MKPQTRDALLTFWPMAVIGPAFLWLVMWLATDANGYARCVDCGAAHQLRFGLPGQHKLSGACKFCGGDLEPCSKERSGWKDSIPMSQWKWTR